MNMRSSPKARSSCRPTTKSRMAINETIHYAMQDTYQMPYVEHQMRVLVARQEITGPTASGPRSTNPAMSCATPRAARHSALHRESMRASRALTRNRITSRSNGRTGQRLSYDPRRLQGVTLYREAERAFSEGDRVQFTAPDREQHVANRELGTIEKIDESGNLQVRLDSGRAVAFNVERIRISTTATP